MGVAPAGRRRDLYAVRRRRVARAGRTLRSGWGGGCRRRRCWLLLWFLLLVSALGEHGGVGHRRARHPGGGRLVGHSLRASRRAPPLRAGVRQRARHASFKAAWKPPLHYLRFLRFPVFAQRSDAIRVRASTHKQLYAERRVQGKLRTDAAIGGSWLQALLGRTSAARAPPSEYKITG